MISGFVPLILTGKPYLGTGFTYYTWTKRHIIRSILCVTCALAIVQPVGKTKTVIPTYVIDRSVCPICNYRIGVTAGATASLNLTTIIIAWPHRCVIQSMRVRSSYSIEKFGVLACRNFIGANTVNFRDTSISGIIVGITRIAHRNPVNGYCLCKWTKNKHTENCKYSFHWFSPFFLKIH